MFEMQRRWITGTAIGLLLIALIIAVLAFATASTPDASPRCFPDFAHSQFPAWLGCALAVHETLAGSLIAASGALFGAWLAFSGLVEQIGLARTNERKTKLIEAEKCAQDTGRDVDLMMIARDFIQETADKFPQVDNPGVVARGAYAARLLDLWATGDLRISSNAAKAPDRNGDSVLTVMNRLNDLASNLNEQTKDLSAEIRGGILRGREPAVIEQIKALRQLAELLNGQLPKYRAKFEVAAAELEALRQSGR